MDPSSGGAGPSGRPQDLKNVFDGLSGSELREMLAFAAARDPAGVQQLMAQLQQQGPLQRTSNPGNAPLHGRAAPAALVQPTASATPAQMPMFALVNLTSSHQYAAAPALVTPLAYTVDPNTAAAAASPTALMAATGLGSAGTFPFLVAAAAAASGSSPLGRAGSNGLGTPPLGAGRSGGLGHRRSGSQASLASSVQSQHQHSRSHYSQQQDSSPLTPREQARKGRREYSEHFMLFSYKVKACTRRDGHDFHTCPYSHPSPFNKGPAQRRDPRAVHYVPVMCPYLAAGSCSLEDCPFAHNTFECCAHPLNYRTIPCRKGNACVHPFCSFTHNPQEVRRPDWSYCPTLKEFLHAESRRPAEDRSAVDPYELRDKAGKAKLLLRDSNGAPRWPGHKSCGSSGNGVWGELPYHRKGSPSRASSMGDPAPGTPDAEPGTCDPRAVAAQSSSGEESFPPSGNNSDAGATTEVGVASGSGAAAAGPVHDAGEADEGPGSSGTDASSSDAATPVSCSAEPFGEDVSADGSGGAGPSDAQQQDEQHLQGTSSVERSCATEDSAADSSLAEATGRKLCVSVPVPVAEVDDLDTDIPEDAADVDGSPSTSSASSGDDSDDSCISEERFALTVRGLDGREFSVEAYETELVSKVVRRVRQVGGYSMLVYLMAHGAVMQPTATLKSCGVDAETTLQVLAASGTPGSSKHHP